MSKEKCTLLINGIEHSFDVEGDFYVGNDEVIYKKSGGKIDNLPWFKKGYHIIEIFEEQEFLNFKWDVSRILVDIINSVSPLENKQSFQLENYHRFVSTDFQHQKVIEQTRNLENSDFSIDLRLLCKNIGEKLGLQLSPYIPELNKTHVQLRISRPNSLDINPPHRDGYLSYWEDILNLWIPIAGCNEKSSLPVLPESHLINENKIIRTDAKSAKINGNTYYVPCILKTLDGSFKMHRPNPEYGSALVFTPFLIHGAAINANTDLTRMSLELRLRIT